MIAADEMDRAELAVRLKLSALDTTQERCGLPDLASGDLTWEERRQELMLSVLGLPFCERPPADQVARVAAHAVSFLVALERAESLDVTTGEAA